MTKLITKLITKLFRGLLLLLIVFIFFPNILVKLMKNLFYFLIVVKRKLIINFAFYSVKKHINFLFPGILRFFWRSFVLRNKLFYLLKIL